MAVLLQLVIPLLTALQRLPVTVPRGAWEALHGLPTSSLPVLSTLLHAGLRSYFL